MEFEMEERSWNVPDPDTWMYHQRLAHEGRIFKASQGYSLARKGWVDTPAKFGKGLRGRWYTAQDVTKDFIKANWKFLIEMLGVIGVIVATLYAK